MEEKQLLLLSKDQRQSFVRVTWVTEEARDKPLCRCHHLFLDTTCFDSVKVGFLPPGQTKNTVFFQKNDAVC